MKRIPTDRMTANKDAPFRVVDLWADRKGLWGGQVGVRWDLVQTTSQPST